MTEWQWCSFDELSGAELYAVLAARQEVFILEQTCFYNDMDGHDLAAHHLLGWREIRGERRLAAYMRVLAPGAKYPELSIGRVLTTPAARGSGVGKELLEQGIWHAGQLYPGQHIRIGAQRYLEQFYASFGFKTVSEPYDEDGIVHIDMLL
ncbi:MAG: GNAT family N-acetyltransferase [Pseudomonadota bacterium]